MLAGVLGEVVTEQVLGAALKAGARRGERLRAQGSGRINPQGDRKLNKVAVRVGAGRKRAGDKVAPEVDRVEKRRSAVEHGGEVTVLI